MMTSVEAPPLPPAPEPPPSPIRCPAFDYSSGSLVLISVYPPTTLEVTWRPPHPLSTRWIPVKGAFALGTKSKKFPGVVVCGSRSLWESWRGAVAVWGSCGVGEMWCGGDAVWGSRGVEESWCRGVG